MLDPARLAERHEFYFELLPELARWGYNTLWLHLTDDEGCALRLRSTPRVPTAYGFTPSEVGRLVSAARALGIEVVPEIETLGHSLWITRHEEYAHLLDGDPWDHNALCPSHPDTLELLRPIIEETAALFGGRLFHAGLDEAVFEECDRCRKRAEGKPPWWLFAEHTKAVHRIVSECGMRMIMWADPVENHPELLDVLPNDILLAHWHYEEVPIAAIEASLVAGFEVVCVPALSGDMVQPNALNLQNIRETAVAAGRLSAKGSVGLVACWWEPFRILRDSAGFAIAYGGSSFAARGPVEPSQFAQRFTSDYFGIEDPGAAEAVVKLHELAPSMREAKAFYPDSAVDLHIALTLAARKDFPARSETAEAGERELERLRSHARKHPKQYDALLLSARLVAGGYRNAARLSRLYEACEKAAAMIDENRPPEQFRPWLDRARSVLEELAGETRELTAAVSDEWDRTRYARDPKKGGASLLLRQRARRALLADLLRASSYLDRLLRAPDSAVLGRRPPA